MNDAIRPRGKRKYPENVTKNMSVRTDAELKKLKEKYNNPAYMDEAIDNLAEGMAQWIKDWDKNNR